MVRDHTSMLEIAQAAGIAPVEFTARWGVPGPELGLPMHDTKDRYGFVPHEVGDRVANRLKQ